VADLKRWANKMKYALLCVWLIALSGCASFQHGLAREKKVEAFPPTEEVVSFLRALPNVTRVSVLRHDGRSNLEYALGLNEGSVDEIVVSLSDFSFHISFDTRKRAKTVLVWRHENTERPFRYSLEEMRDKMAGIVSALHHNFPAIPTWESMDEWPMGPEGK